MFSPKEAVLKTTELLEGILHNLDIDILGMRTLLLSQRVNHTFNATTSGSPKLQQFLFFTPTPSDSHPSISLESPENPLFKRRLINDSTNTSALKINTMEFSNSDGNVIILGFYYASNMPNVGSWQRMYPYRFPTSVFSDFIYPEIITRNERSREEYSDIVLEERMTMGETATLALQRSLYRW